MQPIDRKLGEKISVTTAWMCANAIRVHTLSCILVELYSLDPCPSELALHDIVKKHTLFAENGIKAAYVMHLQVHRYTLACEPLSASTRRIFKSYQLLDDSKKIRP